MGIATLLKSSEVSNHQNDLIWNLMPESGLTQTSHTSQGDQDQGAVTQASAAHEQPSSSTSETTVVDAEESTRMGSQRPSVLDEDLELSVTHDKDEDMDDGGQSSTDQDLSGDNDLSLLDRLYMEEAGDTLLSESEIFNASLGNGNHRRESLNPLICEGEESIMSQRNASDSIKIFSKDRPDESCMIQQPIKVKPKKDVQTRSGTIVSRTGSKQHLKYQAPKDKEDRSRSNRRSLRELPSHTSNPKQASNFITCDYTVKCEFCGKRLQKKSMKNHMTKIHFNRLFECRKCGCKFLREPTREEHEKVCAISYDEVSS